MKRILISGFLLFSLFIQAQEQNQFAYPLKNRPEKFDAYGDVTYYYMKDKVFNLREHALCKTDEIIDFKVNPSGSSYVVITKSKNQKKKVIIYDLWKSNKKLAELSKLSFDPQAVCYTGNARKLLLAGADGNVYFYDAITGKSGETITLQQAATALFASSNNYFMAAIHNASIEVWNMQNQSLRRTLKMSADVRQVDFSLDGQKMAVLTSDSKLTIYDTHTFEVFQAIDALGNAVYCSFHPEGKYIAVITGDSRILVLNLLNLKKREYVDSDESGINYVRFVKNNNRENIYLSYNTLSNIVFRNMNDLSPLHSKLIADKLQEKMDEWEKQMPGESLDEYRMRVNDLSRTEQIKLFEQEIATQMALDENGLAEMTTGAYNSETQMLSVELGGLPDIFLSVPEADVAAFMKPENLEFHNV